MLSNIVLSVVAVSVGNAESTPRLVKRLARKKPTITLGSSEACNHELESCYECDGEWVMKPCHCYIPAGEYAYYYDDSQYYYESYYDGQDDPCTTEGNGGLECDIYDAVCDIVIGAAGKAASKAECVADDALIAGACETAGIGPEDPLSDICAVTFATLFQTACSEAISEAGKFTKEGCKAAGGCSSTSLAFSKKMRKRKPNKMAALGHAAGAAALEAIAKHEAGLMMKHSAGQAGPAVQ